MYFIISELLFWCYWLIAAVSVVLIVRELFRDANWRGQLTAALAIIPFVLRLLLIK